MDKRLFIAMLTLSVILVTSCLLGHDIDAIREMARRNGEPPEPVITITLADIIDPNIAIDPIPSNLVIFISGDPKTAVIAVEGGFDRIEWWYNNTRIATDATLTISVDPLNSNYNKDFDVARIHLITIMVEIGGVPYSRRIEFEVKP